MNDIYTNRIAAVRNKLIELKIDGVWIESPLNRRWLSGFTGSSGILLLTADEALLATDFRYWNQALQQAPAFELFKFGELTNSDLSNRISGKTIAVEASHLTLARFHALRKEEAVTWKPFPQLIDPMREVKTTAEIEQIRAAAAITDLVMAQVNDIAKAGMSEKALAWELERRMREAGATGMAFDIIVASGPNGAKPHHHPSDRPLQIGDPITIDMGAELNGYHSDMTRTFHLGNNPDAKFWEIYNLVLESQQTALEGMRAGMSGKEIDSLARDIIAAGGHGDAFGHSLGHGVGLEIHEGPRLSQLSDSPILENSVVTVEPGIYLDGWSGMRIEDLVVMKADGIKFLSNCPKNPIIPTE